MRDAYNNRMYGVREAYKDCMVVLALCSTGRSGPKKRTVYVKQTCMVVGYDSRCRVVVNGPLKSGNLEALHTYTHSPL